MLVVNHKMEQSLTEIEALGLNSKYDLANGHASHELTLSQQLIIERLPSLWMKSAAQTSHDAELNYKHAFQQLANTPSLKSYDYFKICPTASNSIDLAAAWLAANNMKTALIEPTFDNLYLILKRRNVNLTPLPEDSLHHQDFNKILNDIDAIFLVNPNNPTGKVISQELFAEIIDWCASNNKTLVIDNSFRFFIPQTFDIYAMMLASGITFISFEDTGKVWPSQEIKASLVFTSKNIFHEIDMIYDEIFLCHSNFSLNILTEFLQDAHDHGLEKSVWQHVAARRKAFRDSLDNNILSIHPASINTTLSVEWCVVGEYFESDVACASYFSKNNLILLPGRQFYWAHQGSQTITQYVRFALLKPKHVFVNAIEALNQELKRLHHAKN